MSDLTIRSATVGDARSVAVVHVASWQAAYRGLIDQHVLDSLDVDRRAEGWSRIIASAVSTHGSGQAHAPSHRLLVAERDGRIAGWASFGAGRDPGTGDLGELAGLYVHPDDWSTRVGHALLARVEEDLLAGGWTDAYLWVLAGNDRAIGFYERHGWHADGGEKTGDAGGATGLHELRHRRRLG